MSDPALDRATFRAILGQVRHLTDEVDMSGLTRAVREAGAREDARLATFAPVTSMLMVGVMALVEIGVSSEAIRAIVAELCRAVGREDEEAAYAWQSLVYLTPESSADAEAYLCRVERLLVGVVAELDAACQPGRLADVAAVLVDLTIGAWSPSTIQ